MHRCLAVVVVFVAIQSSRAAEFFGLGDLPGGDFYSLAEAISADASTVVGNTADASGVQAFRWTETSGLQPLVTVLPKGQQVSARDVSADGNVVVGSWYAGQETQAFRWDFETGLMPLGDLPGEPASGFATGVSADGTVVVGTGNFSAGGGPRPITGEAFRWTVDSGLIGLGDLPDGPRCSRGSDVSADGLVIVGKGDCGASFQIEDLGQAARWTAADGWLGLGYLPGGEGLSFANAVSDDGNVIVGASRDNPRALGAPQAFRWSAADGMEPLFGEDSSRISSAALGLNADASVIVGWSWNNDTQEGEAFFWTHRAGPRDLGAMLEQQGLAGELKGWHLESAIGTSADGFTIVGNGTDPDGNAEAWMARVDPDVPGDFTHDGQLDAADINRLTAAVRLGRPRHPYDLNQNGQADALDRWVWVSDLAGTYFGDANLDGRFDTADFVQVFQQGEYEDTLAGNSLWESGDWDGDGEFGTSDLVLGFQFGCYEDRCRAAEPRAAVPEPTTLWLLMLGCGITYRQILRRTPPLIACG